MVINIGQLLEQDYTAVSRRYQLLAIGQLRCAGHGTSTTDWHGVAGLELACATSRLLVKIHASCDPHAREHAGTNSHKRAGLGCCAWQSVGHVSWCDLRAHGRWLDVPGARRHRGREWCSACGLGRQRHPQSQCKIKNRTAKKRRVVSVPGCDGCEAARLFGAAIV